MIYMKKAKEKSVKLVDKEKNFVIHAMKDIYYTSNKIEDYVCRKCSI